MLVPDEWHGKQQPAARPQHAVDLRDKGVGREHVLEDLRAQHAVKARVGQRKAGPIVEHLRHADLPSEGVVDIQTGVARRRHERAVGLAAAAGVEHLAGQLREQRAQLAEQAAAGEIERVDQQPEPGRLVLLAPPTGPES